MQCGMAKPVSFSTPADLDPWLPPDQPLEAQHFLMCTLLNLLPTTTPIPPPPCALLFVSLTTSLSSKKHLLQTYQEPGPMLGAVLNMFLSPQGTETSKCLNIAQQV